MSAQASTWSSLCTALVAAVPLVALPATVQDRAVAPAPARTVLDLQAARPSESVTLGSAAGHRGSLTLTHLNPAVNAWLLLTLQAPGSRAAVAYHLENAAPSRQRIGLDPARPGQLTITAGDATNFCTLWPGSALELARRSMLPYAPLCEGRLYLRNAVYGNRSTLEATTEFLRDHVWRGEQIIGFVRREFYRDAFATRGTSASAPFSDAGRAVPPEAPPAARMQGAGPQRALVAEGLGIDLSVQGGLVPGQWYGAAGLDGVYASIAQPGALSAGVAQRRPLDGVEADALAYLVAFDLAAFDLAFALGTEHPRLGWSQHMRDELRNPRLPGPDGIDNAAPLARTGMVSPALQARYR